MVAKITRTFRRPPEVLSPRREVLQIDARRFPRVRQIQAIVTSPPYMNELDYLRDNRLRLWFIERRLPNGIECATYKREEAFRLLISDVCGRLGPQVKKRGYIVLVLGEVTRGGQKADPATIVREVFEKHEELRQFALTKELVDAIPDIRRSRRECRGTKVETVMIYRHIN